MSKHFRSDNETFNGEDKHQEQNHGEDINAKSILDKLRMTPARYGNQMESQGNSNEGAKKVIYNPMSTLLDHYRDTPLLN